MHALSFSCTSSFEENSFYQHNAQSYTNGNKGPLIFVTHTSVLVREWEEDDWQWRAWMRTEATFKPSALHAFESVWTCVFAPAACVVRLCVALSVTSVYQLNKCLSRGAAARWRGSSAVQWGCQSALQPSIHWCVYPSTPPCVILRRLKKKTKKTFPFVREASGIIPTQCL